MKVISREKVDGKIVVVAELASGKIITTIDGKLQK